MHEVLNDHPETTKQNITVRLNRRTLLEAQGTGSEAKYLHQRMFEQAVYQLLSAVTGSGVRRPSAYC